jgi:hypothetical protein
LRVESPTAGSTGRPRVALKSVRPGWWRAKSLAPKVDRVNGKCEMHSIRSGFEFRHDYSMASPDRLRSISLSFETGPEEACA